MAIEPDRIVLNFLRQNLTDLNSSRAGTYWIFIEEPETEDLTINHYPRVILTPLTESGERQGIFDDSTWETLNYQIDVVTKTGLFLTKTNTDDSLGTISNDPRLIFDFVPNSVTNIKHTVTGFGTVTKKDTDADFTAPAGLAAGTVEWSYSTGNLNFSDADLTSYSGETITSTYATKLSRKKLVKYLARDIIKLFRSSWRGDTTIKGVFYPVKISNSVVPFEEESGIYRQLLEYKFNAINAGE